MIHVATGQMMLCAFVPLPFRYVKTWRAVLYRHHDAKSTSGIPTVYRVDAAVGETQFAGPDKYREAILGGPHRMAAA